MKKLPVPLIAGVVTTLLVVGGIVYLAVTAKPAPSKYDDFAKCLTEKGAVFYGAFWCPHCQAQKKAFGSSMQYVSYTECSTSDGNAMLPVCKDKKIEGYPTWIFADGSRESGEVSMEKLAEKTSCTLPK